MLAGGVVETKGPGGGAQCETYGIGSHKFLSFPLSYSLVECLHILIFLIY